MVTEGNDGIIVYSDDPLTYREAMGSSYSEKWLKAMKEEMQSMYDNQVCDLVDPTPGVKTIGCKWIYKIKHDMNDIPQTYKARLVEKGFKQTHGVDYDETFSPVAMVKSIRIILAIAAYHDYEIWQMDVKTFFLNGKLSEDVYMTQPEGFCRFQECKKDLQAAEDQFMDWSKLLGVGTYALMKP